MAEPPGAPEVAWDPEGVLHFRTGGVEGSFLADGRRHGLVRLVHAPTGTSVTGGPLLALYRLLCRGGWMGEAREMPHAVFPRADGVELRWRPSVTHQAALCARLRVRPEAALDLEVGVVGHAFYPGYEVFVSNYLNPVFRPSGYVLPLPGESVDAPGAVRVSPVLSPLYRGMYVSLPRDEAAAHLFTDGRWQRGRHHTRFLPARYYARPLVVACQPETGVDALLVGLDADVAAVSMAYAGLDGEEDEVARHHSLYVSLWGRDLSPGAAWRTVVRLQVGQWGGEATAHLRVCDGFAADQGAGVGDGEVSEVEERLLGTW
jgi:hypothetical protein